MNYHQVTIEVPVFITVANIEAESSANAVSIATSLIDHKALIERNPRSYDVELPMGSITSIEVPDVAIAAEVKVIFEDDSTISSQYEITQTLQILPSEVQPRILVVEAARAAYDVIAKIYDESTNEQLKSDIGQALKILMASGIKTVPLTIEQQLNPSVQPEVTETELTEIQVYSEQTPEELDEELLTKIVALIPDHDESSFLFQAPIFVATATDTDTDPDNPIQGWSIQFGEIDVIYKGKKIAAIGTWREFSNQSITYFDSETDVLVARHALLLNSELPYFFTEKPNLPDKLFAEVDLNLVR
jgi:hypothetical protein